MTSKHARLLLIVLLPAFPAAQGPIPAALEEMADTEREFARTATVKGVRDAFLEFFADDSIALRPTPVPAKDGLRKQPARPFSENGIIWEPRTGDVTASGEIGWLTGPATFTKGPDAKPVGYGCYLSVWRKQADGRWRVYIDIGTDVPEPAPFAPGFTRTTLRRPYRGKESKEDAARGLVESDRLLNEQAAGSAKAAYTSVLTPMSRVHRPGRLPLVGPDAVAAFFDANASGLTMETGSAEASGAADFGYSYGVYTRTGGDKPETGPYVRIWSRDESGRWWLMADVAHPLR